MLTKDEAENKLKDIVDIFNRLKSNKIKTLSIRHHNETIFCHCRFENWNEKVNYCFRYKNNQINLLNKISLLFIVESDIVKPFFRGKLSNIIKILSEIGLEAKEESENSKVRIVIYPNESSSNEDIAKMMLKFINHTNNYINNILEGKILNSNINNKNMNTQKVINYPLNQILYGPPGTGKTYNTINYALAIIENETIENIKEKYSRKELIQKFNEYKSNEQIEFVTFHQNYSYEDFIQGIKPNINNNDSLSFERNNGIFFKISKKALENKKVSNFNNHETIKKPFDIVFMDLIKPLNENNTPIEIKMKQSSYNIIEVNDKTIYFKKQTGDSEHSLSIKTLEKMYDNGKNNVIYGGLQPYYNPLLEALLEKSKQDNSIKEKEKNYVLIIDEINRANISRVFGELITLIEEDKRYGNENQMEVTLPSGDTFTVPSNLYIIGTMNTADKSIALLDIALRRRFKFISMYPDYSLIDDSKLQTILKALNKEIKEKKGTDFMIGHSFFINKTEEHLKDIVEKDLIPLLSEYFNNSRYA